MATLWKARVVEVSDDSVVLTLYAVHPDAGVASGRRSFAFRVLVDAPRPDGPPDPPLEEIDSMAPLVVESSKLDELRLLPFDEPAALARVERELREQGFSPRDEGAWEDAFGERWRAIWAELAIPN